MSLWIVTVKVIPSESRNLRCRRHTDESVSYFPVSSLPDLYVLYLLAISTMVHAGFSLTICLKPASYVITNSWWAMPRPALVSYTLFSWFLLFHAPFFGTKFWFSSWDFSSVVKVPDFSWTLLVNKMFLFSLQNTFT